MTRREILKRRRERFYNVVYILLLTSVLIFVRSETRVESHIGSLPINKTLYFSGLNTNETDYIPEESVVMEAPPSKVVEVVSEPAPLATSSTPINVSEEDIDLIALITMAEAEGEPELCKRLVIDTILNRVNSERFANTVYDVIYAKGQFECLWNGRVDRCYVRDDIKQLVIEELSSRTRSDVYYFRAGHYHNFGIPVIHSGNTYFSKY